jgi:hypothetical protein
MKTNLISILIIALLAFSSCKLKPKEDEKEKTKLKKNDALIIGNPFDYGINDLLLFPVGSNYKPEIIENRNTDAEIKTINAVQNLSFSVNCGTLNDRMAQKEYINNNEDKFDIRNILFYNLKTGLTYPLISDTLHILSFALHKEFDKSLIFYRIVKNDINKDSIFNSHDPVMLFVSDIYGKNLTQITPDNEQFVDYFYYPQTQTILIKTIIDADKDKNFTNFDETNFREMKIKEPAMGREIFKKSLKDSLRIQMKSL